MPGRRCSRARRWTHKKSKSAHLQFGEPTAPKAGVWEALEQHGTFVGECKCIYMYKWVHSQTAVMDEDGEQHPFKLNDV
jgi:hypothetical protein